MHLLQTEYALALASHQTFEAAEAEHERAYCAARGLLDTEGKPAQRIYHLTDADFETANDAFTTAMADFYRGMQAARDRLKAAEDALIAYGLSIMPASLSSEREALAASARSSAVTRQKIIALIFRLDTRTVRASNA